jgi:hypothetical protein
VKLLCLPEYDKNLFVIDNLKNWGISLIVDKVKYILYRHFSEDW